MEHSTAKPHASELLAGVPQAKEQEKYGGYDPAGVARLQPSQVFNKGGGQWDSIVSPDTIPNNPGVWEAVPSCYDKTQ